MPPLLPWLHGLHMATRLGPGAGPALLWPCAAPHLGAVGAGHKLHVVMKVLGIYFGLDESLCQGLICWSSVTSRQPLGSSLLGHVVLWLWHCGVGHWGLEQQQQQQLWGARSQGSGFCWGSLSGVVSALALVFPMFHSVPGAVPAAVPGATQSVRVLPGGIAWVSRRDNTVD